MVESWSLCKYHAQFVEESFPVFSRWDIHEVECDPLLRGGIVPDSVVWLAVR